MKRWVLNDYEIIRTLGSGGQASVYLAQKKKAKLKLHRLFAIKEIKKHNVNLEYFTNEVEILSHLHHQNICHIYDADETESNFYILMEYIEGCSLREFLDEVVKKNINFSIGDGLEIIEPIITALIYAHEHEDGPILHKDICTSNIMISKTGKVTLIDFGIGQFGEESNKILQGKPAFLPESVINGKSQYSIATDFYSIGVVAYFIFTNQKIRNQKDIDFEKVEDEELKEIIKNLIDFDGDYQSLVSKVDDVQIKHRGKLKKICKLVFDKKFRGEKKIIPKNILKYSFLNFFGFLEPLKDDSIIECTINVNLKSKWKKRKVILCLFAISFFAFSIIKIMN